MSQTDLDQALAAFPTLDRTALVSAWDSRQLLLPDVELRVIVGDARITVPRWDGSADAWFLDGFAPAQNPELWEPSLLQSVAEHTNPAGTLATYTAAGTVRRALADAGFAVERCAGFGRKRHITRGRLL